MLGLVGRLGSVMAAFFLIGLGVLGRPGLGLRYFAAVAVPAASCCLLSALLRNIDRWKRQAATGDAVQSIGVLRLAAAIALGREHTAIRRAEAEADRIAAARREESQPVAETSGQGVDAATAMDAVPVASRREAASPPTLH
jgi:hypothetical protein